MTICKKESYEDKEKGEGTEQERRKVIEMEEKVGKKGKRLIKFLILNIL